MKRYMNGMMMGAVMAGFWFLKRRPVRRGLYQAAGRKMRRWAPQAARAAWFGGRQALRFARRRIG